MSAPDANPSLLEDDRGFVSLGLDCNAVIEVG